MEKGTVFPSRLSFINNLLGLSVSIRQGITRALHQQAHCNGIVSVWTSSREEQMEAVKGCYALSLSNMTSSYRMANNLRMYFTI